MYSTLNPVLPDEFENAKFIKKKKKFVFISVNRPDRNKNINLF